MIDLRSDTSTLPTEIMRDAMRNAEVGDDSRGEDPTVAKLEALSAQLTGKEAALFFCSGTMANIVAVLSQVKHGETVAVDQEAHIYETEFSIFSEEYFGRKARFIDSDTYGKPKLLSIQSLVANEDVKLLCLENTLGEYGGTCLTAEEIKDICAVAKKHQVPVHLDGARIFNAATYLNIPVADLVKPADSVMFCLSKGLGAPVGSMLCGTKEVIAKARETRKAIGGNMRQSGIVAAAGIIALQEASRIKEDHMNTQLLLHKINAQALLQIDPATVQTNFIKIDITATKLSAEECMNRLKTKGLLVETIGEDYLRLVLHKNVSSTQVNKAAEILNSFCKEMS
ncbi:threonine aldolase family protein [Sporosarcina sp. CAU 1771]